MKIDNISVTKLSLYDNCPRCFFYQAQGIPQVSSPEAKTGSLYHEGVEYYHRDILYKPRKDIKLYLEEYKKMYTHPYELLEYKMTLPLKDPRTGRNIGVTLTGKPDLVKDGWIHEHKTSKRRYTQDRVDEDAQVTGYSYLYRASKGKEEKGIRFNVLVKNVTPYIQTLDTFRTISDYVFWFNWVEKILENIKSDRFEPKKAFWHSYQICEGNLL